MCNLLVNPDSYDVNTSHQLLPAEFSWSNLVEAAGNHINFQADKTIYYTTLSYDGRVMASGMMGHRGEFSQAIGIMLELIGK